MKLGNNYKLRKEKRKKITKKPANCTEDDLQ